MGIHARNPITIVIAAIAALVAAFIYLWNHSEAFRQFWINLWEEIKNAVSTAVEGIMSFLETAWSTITTALETLWNHICAIATTVWTAVSTAITTIMQTMRHASFLHDTARPRGADALCRVDITLFTASASTLSSSKSPCAYHVRHDK